MNNMKFSAPECEVVKFTADIIATSVDYYEGDKTTPGGGAGAWDEN